MEHEKSRREDEEHHEWQHCRGLHFTRQGLAHALEVVPPRQVSRKEVERCLVAQGLGDESRYRLCISTKVGGADGDNCILCLWVLINRQAKDSAQSKHHNEE